MSREAALQVHRSEPEKASICSSPDLWRGLASGRWFVSAVFERDGRRYLIVRRAAPDEVRRRALSSTEIVVAERICAGLTNKEIAHELRVAPTTVAGRLARALKKLGLPNRVALLRLLPRSVIDRG